MGKTWQDETNTERKTGIGENKNNPIILKPLISVSQGPLFHWLLSSWSVDIYPLCEMLEYHVNILAGIELELLFL